MDGLKYGESSTMLITPEILQHLADSTRIKLFVHRRVWPFLYYSMRISEYLNDCVNGKLDLAQGLYSSSLHLSTKSNEPSTRPILTLL